MPFLFLDKIMVEYVPNYFSFRAECAHDVTEFVVAAHKAGVAVVVTRLNPMMFNETDPMPDTTAEFYCHGGALEQMRDVLRTIPDSHVMLQTIQQVRLKDNKLERDYSID